MNNKYFIKDIGFHQIDEMIGEKVGYWDTKNNIIYISPACFSLIKTDYELVGPKLPLIKIELEGDFLEWYLENKKEQNGPSKI